MLAGNASTCVVDGFLMLLCPATELLQYGYLLLRNGAVLLRTDVEKHIATHRQTVNEGAQKDVGRLIVGVSMLISP